MARRWSLLCVLASFACSQSLFDSNPDNGKDGGPGGGRDGGDGDGAPPTSNCPEPCAGDAAADFATEQGAGVWYYLHDLGAANGADYDDMEFGTWGALDAWSGDTEGPAIASCTGESDAACAGLDGFLLLVPGAGNERPALTFRAPESATYSISGAVRIADGGPTDVPMQLLISRAGRHDAIALQSLRTSESEAGISGLVPAIEGDEIMLSIGSDEEMPPVGVRLFFTRVDSGADMFPGSCQVALRFDSGASLDESCRDTTVVDDSFTGMTTSGVGPSSRLGDARVFVVDQYLQLGNAPMDYRGDFTVQFWAKFTEPQPDFDVVPFADTSDPASSVHGGQVILRPSADAGNLEFCYYHHEVVGNRLCLYPDMPTDGGWHFWRITRSTESGRYQLCIDGGEITSTTVPANADMTSDEPPRLGRFVNFTPPYFTGSMDEVRIFSEALPCVTAP